ncbi:MAG TPA: isoprenyl transferase [Phycisphaerales bacterium]|nr:isoprenyl transferase [Phycisphaerales bacterium]
MTDANEKLRATAERLGIDVRGMPRHIAIIMDGNGRWAQRRGLPRAEGHRQGGKTVEQIAQLCVDFGIESLTLYSFSIENWKRPRNEVNALMSLYEQYLIAIRPTLMRNRVRLVHLGVMEMLPAAVKKELVGTMEMTAENDGMVLALALNYGGRTEIVEAARRVAQDYKAGRVTLDGIDEAYFADRLYTTGLAEPDLLIRTANEMRISNFLLWQVSYSEFYVTKTLWPDFKRRTLEQAIGAYSRRVRRFGAVTT